MKAIAKRAAEPGVEIVDMQKPEVGEFDILVRVLAGSLCGSDVHIYEWTAGTLDFVFEATGIPHTISQGLQILKKGGKVMVVGIHADEASFDPIDLVRHSKSLIGVYGYERNTWSRALRLMSTGKINIAPISTHRLPFSRGKEGFELALSRIAAKVVFVPEG